MASFAKCDLEAIALEYKHKKFDVSKRTRSSSTCSIVDVCTLEGSSGSSTPLGFSSEYTAAPPSFRKRSHTSPEMAQPPLKRRLLLTENNDSGISLASRKFADDISASAYPRYTSTPLPLEPAAMTAFKRRLCNDSGVSVTPRRIDDDTCSVDFSARLTALHPRYTSTPLTVLADVAASTPPMKRRRLSTDSNFSATTTHHNHNAPRTGSCSTSHLLAHPRYTSTPLAVLAAVATTAPPPKNAPSILMPQISNETMQNICKYHENMVRRFPKKERTPKDQERRNKNTIACRVSRRLKKLENVAIEEQYKDFGRQHSEIVEASVRAAAYLNALRVRLAAAGGHRWTCGKEKAEAEAAGATSSSNPDNKQSSTAVVRQPKPFTIEYIMGQDGSS